MLKTYFLIFLSPIVSLIILGVIAFYLARKAKTVRPSPKDYILLFNLEKKFSKYFSFERVIRYFKEMEGVILNIILKILQRIKTEALRLQIWAEKYLTAIREKQK